jgi:flavin reductase (DIM6/NTAB) family NADH-FMN oxidoreductase RutF
MSEIESARLDWVEAATAVPRAEFAEVMSRMAATVCVVSAVDGAGRHGRTATAVLSLSADPPSILVSIKAGSVLAGAIKAAGGFSLAMLAQGQELVADAFAGRVAPDKRHLIGVWGAWPSGRPHLLGTSAALDCELSGAISAADHELFVGTIVATDIPEHSRPLLWSRRDYRTLKDEHDHPAREAAASLPLPRKASIAG